ncbi:hemerythrin domain-containing protein [Streptomyces sp. NPDC088812]|uniref:hemerythrin domain-containing protein n=1 Tax=Streptomyces sp. NPDC088812 TaxID=3365905 RepID=UPI0037FD43E3
MSERSDVVELLVEQHARIRKLFEEVARAGGEERRRAFQDLVRLLAVHETVEEEVVHPFVRRHLRGGARLAGRRIAEEARAGRALARLDAVEPDSPAFPGLLAALRRDVLAHAAAEERYEFPRLDQVADGGGLAALAHAVRAADALVPTRPHPVTATGAVRDGPEPDAGPAPGGRGADTGGGRGGPGADAGPGHAAAAAGPRSAGRRARDGRTAGGWREGSSRAGRPH